MRSKKRQLDGVLLLDKPIGPSSNAALQRVKWLYKGDKAGHTGSLDPLASGLLPICFGEATKLSSYLLTGDKGYRAVARFGIRTDTLDAAGRPVAEAPIAAVERIDIEALLPQFRGEIEQIPPMFSALKRGGTALYELARQGVEIDRDPRRVIVHRFDLLEWTPPFAVFDIDCASGTYIRSLIDDLGQTLGCGAHVHTLRRTWAAPFADPDMHPMSELDARQGDLGALDALLMPVEILAAGMPSAQIGGDDLVRFSHGNPVTLPSAPIAEPVAIFNADRQLLGIARCNDGRTLKAVRVLNR